MKFYSLDIETSSKDPKHPEYALQPWRSEFSVDLVMANTMAPLEGEFVFTWNGIFDIAGLIAREKQIDCSKIKWLDAMSAAKWILRSQQTDPPEGARYSWSLANVAKDHLKDWAHYAEFMDVKDHYVTAGEDPEYWRRRCELDVEATLRLGVLFWSQMTPQQRRGFLIEQEALYPTAKAWLEGCRYDFKAAERMRRELETNQQDLARQIGSNIDIQTALNHGLLSTDMGKPVNHAGIKKIIASPQQLAVLVYDTWGVPFDEDHGYTEKGARSVGKEALTFLIENHGEQYPQLRLIKEYRKILTDLNKFVAGPEKAREYLGSDVMRHNWRLNSTYTGRCTVSSKIKQG